MESSPVHIEQGIVRKNSSCSTSAGTDLSEHTKKVGVSPSDLEVESPLKPTTEAGFGTGIFNLANAALGAGILFFPFAFSQTGLACGLLFQIPFAAIQFFGVTVLGYAATFTCSDSMTLIVRRLNGKVWGRISIGMLIFFAFTINTAYLQTIMKLLEKVKIAVGDDSWYVDPRFTVSMIAIFLIFPMSCLPDMKSLGFVSFLATAGCAYVTLLVISEYFAGDYTEVVVTRREECKPGELWQYKERGGSELLFATISALPPMCFGYASQVSSVPNYAELKPAAKKYYPWVALAGSVIALTFYSAVGAFGSETFRGCTDTVILSNYKANKIQASVGSGLAGLAVVTSYPIISFTGRQETSILLEEWLSRTNRSCSSILFDTRRKRGLWIITVWFISTLLIAVFVEHIKWVVNLSGMACAGTMFFFPAIVAMKMSRIACAEFSDAALQDLQNLADLDSLENSDSWVGGAKDRIVVWLTRRQSKMLYAAGCLLLVSGGVALTLSMIEYGRDAYNTLKGS